MSKLPYKKPPLSIENQLKLLSKRGMIISDQARAKRYLSFISYYRLSGYWFPFQHRDDSPAHDDFQPGTNFDTILDRYVFDRQLRVLIMDAVERIEVAARTTISNTLCTALNNSRWYLESRHFVEKFDHNEFLSRVEQELQKQQKDAAFLRHYQEKYDSTEKPPSWIAFEVLPFGMVSRIFAHLYPSEQKTIAGLFGLPHERLRSWLHAVSHLRNLCAHHHRVWNRKFRINPSVPKNYRDHATLPNHFYGHAVAIQMFLKRVSGATHWADRLQTLLEDHPNIPHHLMGFPDHWHQEPVWQTKTTESLRPASN